jgi:hypothetical protein
MIFPNPIRFVGAIIRLVAGLFQKKPIFVTQEVEDERWAVCRACEEYVARTEQCRVCTCFLSIKTPLAQEKCPKKKWRR